MPGLLFLIAVHLEVTLLDSLFDFFKIYPMHPENNILSSFSHNN